MKNLPAILILVLFTTTAFATKEINDARNSWVDSVSANVQEILPFLFTIGLGVLQGKLQPNEVSKENAILKHAAFIIPAGCSLANAYARISGIRESRKAFEGNIEVQNSLTTQQDKVMADYAISIPASMLAAFRLATTQDAIARIGYILVTYLLVGGKNSPLDHMKTGIASGLDNWRLVNVTR